MALFSISRTTVSFLAVSSQLGGFCIRGKEFEKAGAGGAAGVIVGTGGLTESSGDVLPLLSSALSASKSSPDGAADVRGSQLVRIEMAG